jgi:hypothetical protein
MTELTLHGSAETLLSVQAALGALLAERTALYTMNESTSVPEQTAQELLRSVCYTLGVDPSAGPEALLALAGADLHKRFARGTQTLQGKIKLGKKLWEAACVSLPEIRNRSLTDTLTSIGQGWDQYDYRYFAHEFPCDVDYQLCLPVPETRYGVDYVVEYLRRVLTENSFLRRFPAENCIRLLERSCGDYRGLLINLFEPAAVNAVGLALLDDDPRTLNVTREQQERLLMLLRPLSKPELTALLSGGAAVLSDRMALSKEERRYLTAAAEELSPHIAAAAAAGDLSQRFWSLEE